MNDFISIMLAHTENCLQAYGFSPSGAKQLANGEKPTKPADQAMLKAYDDKPSVTNKNGSETTLQRQTPRPTPVDLNP